MGNSFFFLDFFGDLLFVNFKRTEFCKVDQISKIQKNSTCKNVSQWSICLNGIYDSSFWSCPCTPVILLVIQEEQRTHGWNGQLVSSLLAYFFKNTFCENI